MGTRADFYVGRGREAEWLGSITWDGYPDGIDDAVFFPTTENEYRTAVTAFFAARDDVTRPTEPWPWPWENSGTTDYAYAYENGKVFASSFGHAWFEVDPNAECYGEPEEREDDEKVVFPDMSSRMGSTNHIMRKSGLITVATDQEGNSSVLTSKDWPED